SSHLPNYRSTINLWITQPITAIGGRCRFSVSAPMGSFDGVQVTPPCPPFPHVDNHLLSAYEMRGAILPVASGEKHMTKSGVRFHRLWTILAHRLGAWQPSRRSDGDDPCACHRLETSCALLTSP